MRSRIRDLCRAAIMVALFVPMLAFGQAPSGSSDRPRVARGIVAAIDNDSLTLTSGEGQKQVIPLAKDWTVSLLKPVQIDAIQPGSFIGTAEMPAKDGTGRSLEVHVFPPGVKAAEGHYDWDLRQGSKMTNGTVGTVTTKSSGRELLVSYPGGERRLVVPKHVPIVQITAGERSLVKSGVPVFVMIAAGPGGRPAAISIAVGEGGAKPPM